MQAIAQTHAHDKVRVKLFLLLLLAPLFHACQPGRTVTCFVSAETRVPSPAPTVSKDSFQTDMMISKALRLRVVLVLMSTRESPRALALILASHA